MRSAAQGFVREGDQGTAEELTREMSWGDRSGVREQGKVCCAREEGSWRADLLEIDVTKRAAAA